ncbi:MAG: hydrogenase expression/formation protein HypE [Coriobacteriaceae bacterium]|nr:hydrogenase expression/formation protein HypE [Coriobacteriaceae bacterium]
MGTQNEFVQLGHGSGGQMMKRLIDEVFLDAFGSPELFAGNDAGVAELPVQAQLDSFARSLGASSARAVASPVSSSAPARIAMSTDSFVVTPQFFPGGDIGRLAVCGTVNDVATSGAQPLYLSCGFILEEGYPLSDLRRICTSMAHTAREAGVRIITGDTKVVERGKADGVYINTAGVGVVPTEVNLSGANCRPGDLVLVSGTLGDHGIAIMSQREGLAFSTPIESDAAPLNHLIAAMLKAAPHTRCFRDPTRGGLASTLNEFAQASGVAITIDEDAVPVRPEVRGACEMLGYDVLQVANEGKIVAVVPAEEAEAALTAMRKSKYGENAAIIGEVSASSEASGTWTEAGQTDSASNQPSSAAIPAGSPGSVRVRTPWGSTRILDMLVGEQLPRIC